MLLKRRKRMHHNEGSWAVSYVDMLTLLLCFFIIFYNNAQNRSASTPLQKIALELAGKGSDKGDGTGRAGSEKGDGAEGAGIATIGMQPGTGGVAGDQQGSGNGTQFGVNLWGLREHEIANIQAANDKNANIMVSPEDLALLELIKERIGRDVPANITMTDKALVINFEGLSFFDSGQVKVRPEAEEKLIKVIALLSKYKDAIRITVQGHTDPTRLSVSRKNFSDNWELSAIRATSVLKVFVNNGFSQEQLSAEGFAETQARKPAEEMTFEELSKLRKITLRIEPLKVD